MRENRGGVRVGVPGGAVGIVGEIAREERVWPSTWVACFEEDVVEDVRDLDRHVRVFDPGGGAGVQLPKGGLVSFVDTVPNCTRKLPKVGMEEAVGSLHV